MTNKITVLIIDDDVKNTSLMRAHLEPAGYRVMVARDAREADVKTRERMPDMFIAEVVVPYREGYELCQWLKGDERTRSIPLLAMSAFHELGKRIREGAFPADDFLPKPFGRAELLSAVETLLV